MANAKERFNQVKHILIVITLTVSVIAILQGSKFMKTYEWFPSESAHSFYPMEIVQADFILQDGTTVYVPDKRRVYNGWGKPGSSHSVGERKKALPVKLGIIWFSYREDKFFQGEFELPTSQLEKYFSQGVEDQLTGKVENWDIISVGMAPQGRVSIWLTGFGNTVQIAHFIAKEVNYAWIDFMPNVDMKRPDFIRLAIQEILPAAQREKLKQMGVPNGLWEKWNQPYNWTLDVHQATTTLQIIEYASGERGPYNAKFLMHDAGRPVPTVVDLHWKKSNGNEYQTTLYFEGDEIFKAFEKLSEGKPGKPLILDVKIDEDTFMAEAFLRDGEFILPLEDFSQESFSM